jgi:ribosomal protein L19E
MADDSALDEIQDNTREAGQRLRASLNLMRSQGMLDDSTHRELATRLRGHANRDAATNGWQLSE